METYRAYDNTSTVDHINNVRHDNRLANLRVASMSEQITNRPSRLDKEELDNNVAVVAGTSHMPRYLRFDKGQGRYTFADHPYIQQLSRHGVSVLYNGTKSDKCTMIEKYADALEKYTHMYMEYSKICADDELELVTKKNTLIMEYRGIMEAVYSYDPLFPRMETFNIDRVETEFEKASKLLHTLQSNCKELNCKQLGGPKHLDATDIMEPGHMAYIRKKGSYTTVYDSKHAAQLANVNWDTDDLRIHISPKLKSYFPLLDSYQGKKIMLADFVYWILEGKTIPEGMTVATINLIRHDVRASNLILVPNNGRGQKPPGDTRPDSNLVGDLGMEYLPRGVSIVRDKANWMYLIKIKGVNDKKLSFKKENAKEVFGKVLVYLREMKADFDEENQRYQELSRTYYAIKATVTENTQDGDAQV